MADRGYDNGADKASLYDKRAIRPMIATRELRQGRMRPLAPAVHDTIYIDPTREVCCKIDTFQPETAKVSAGIQS